LSEANVVYPDAALVAHWRQRLPVRFFLFVGVLRYYKGLHVLLDALAIDALPMVIVGDGPELVALKAQVARLGLTNVYFLGALDDADKAAVLHLCDAFVFPSHLRSEAYGLSLVEAAMCGKAMISCEIGTGTTFVNQAGETGLAIPSNDPKALAVAMRMLWDAPEKTALFGQQARVRFERLFTVEKMVDGYVQCYRSLLNR
jgi:glycosyltransferase involved in cell wall biosynthesis